MGAAAGDAALWKSFADQATARGETPWRSLESPPRPPMLANFGRVSAWMLTAAEITAERPGSAALHQFIRRWPVNWRKSRRQSTS